MGYPGFDLTWGRNFVSGVGEQGRHLFSVWIIVQLIVFLEVFFLLYSYQSLAKNSYVCKASEREEIISLRHKIKDPRPLVRVAVETFNV